MKKKIREAIIREAITKPKKDMFELPDYGTELQSLFKDQVNSPEMHEQIIQYLNNALREQEDQGAIKVDHQGKIIRLFEGTTFDFLQMIVPTLPKYETYTVYLNGLRIGRVAYTGIKVEGSNVEFQYNFEPEAPLEYVQLELKLD